MGNSSAHIIDKLSEFGNKTKKYVNIAYLGALFIFVAFYACTLTRSMPPFLKTLYYISSFILMLVAVYRIIVGKCKFLSSIVFAVSFILASFVIAFTYFLSISSGYINLTLILIALIGAMDVKGDYVLGAGICGNLVMIFNNAVSSVFAEPGLLVNDFQGRDFFYFGDNVFYVSKFNNFSSTDLGAHYYWIVIAYLWVRGKKITWIEITALCALNVFVYSLSASSTTLLCISISIILAVLLKIWQLLDKKNNGIILPKLQSFLGYCSKFSFVILALIIIVASYAYSLSDPLTSRMNSMLHFRLSLGHRGFVEYGVQLLERNIPFYGMSSSLDGFYNFLDSSYISLLIRNGLLMFLLYVGCMTIIQLRQKKSLYGVLLIAICALACFEEHHLSELPYNIFMLLVFADLNIDEKIKDPAKTKSKSELLFKCVSYPLCAGLLIASVGINYPRYQSIKELDRLDNRATDIYVSVQNNIDSLVSSGEWQLETSMMNSLEYGDVLSHPSDYESITGEFWEDATKDPKTHSYYSLYYDPQNIVNSSPMTNLLFSDDTKELIGEGSVIIEYDVASGKVYSVWYSESDNCIEIINGRDITRINRLRDNIQNEGYSTGG